MPSRTGVWPPASMVMRSAWENSALTRWRARRSCAKACRSVRLRQTAVRLRRKSTCWCGDWPGADCWSTVSGTPVTARTRSSSNRRGRIIGRKRLSSAMPKRLCCRGSLICDGAVARWCWNRRAPVRCSEFVTRRSLPPLLCCPRRNNSKNSGGRTAFRGSNSSHCWWIVRFCSSSTLPAATG